MEKENILTIQRDNEPWRQPDTVSQEDINVFFGMGRYYGENIKKTVQQIVPLLNGLTIDQANDRIDLVRGYIKRRAE